MRKASTRSSRPTGKRPRRSSRGTGVIDPGGRGSRGADAHGWHALSNAKGVGSIPTTPFTPFRACHPARLGGSLALPDLGKYRLLFRGVASLVREAKTGEQV